MPTSIYAAGTEKLRDFESWREVPDEFKTRNQWLRAGRKVPSKTKPQARLLHPKLVEHWPGSILEESFLSKVTDDLTLITDPPTALFHLDQTKPYRASPRTLAYFAFEEIFLDLARKDSYIIKFDKEQGQERDSWYTMTAYPTAQNPLDRGFLSPAIIRKHINQREIVGIKATRWTRFVLIDLDFHGRDSQLFEDQAEVLLNEFHGKATWHCQVKRQDVTGLHLIRIFDKPQDLDTITESLRAILRRLDAATPDLARRAREAGMKTLGELEIYPQQDHGVRLPLCFDREMLLDAPLPLVPCKGRMIQDVEKYVEWLKNPNRQYMPKERILDYLHYFARIEAPKPTTVTRNRATGKILAKGWKNNLRRMLPDFWLDGDAHGETLNNHIIVLARLAFVHGHGQHEMERAITGFVKELPPSARSCSSRLLNGKMLSIASVVKTSVKYACDDNGHQLDPALSTKKLEAVLAKWNGFDPLDKETWSSLASTNVVSPEWTEADKNAFVTYLRKPLFVKDESLILQFVNAVVNLTLQKDKAGDGWGKEYLLTWMQDRFPEIKCAKDAKRQRILVALQELGIIEARIKGRPKITATRWVLGERAMKAISSPSDAPGTKEHLSLLEFPFSNHNVEERAISDKADNKEAVASQDRPETLLQPTNKMEGTGSHQEPSDLIEGIWERVEPVYAGVGGGLCINEDAA
jgi:hypothetical protein